MGSMPKNSRVQQQQQQHARSSQKQATRQQWQQTKRRLARTILPATPLIIFFILTPGTKHHGLLRNTTDRYATNQAGDLGALRGAHMETKGIGPLRSTTMGY